MSSGTSDTGRSRSTRPGERPASSNNGRMDSHDPNPELELAKRTAELLNVGLSEADVHRFLLDAAQLLGSPPREIVGPSVRFVWILGERAVEIMPHPPWPRIAERTCRLTVRSYGVSQVIDYFDHQQFEYWEPGDPLPFAWWLAPDDERPYSTPSSPFIKRWKDLDNLIGRTLNELPSDIAMTPPAWRQELGYRLTMSEDSAWRTVSLTGAPEGIRIHARSRCGSTEDILVPRLLLDWRAVSMTGVIAGLAGGCNMADLDLVGSDGMLPDLNHSDRPLRDPDDDVDDDRGRDRAPAGITLEELRALIAQGAPEAKRPAPRDTVSLRAGLSIPQVVTLIEQLLSDSPTEEVLASFGASPGEVFDRPAMVGDDWHAWIEEDKVEIAIGPYADDGTMTDDRECASYAWWLSQSLEQRYGRPFGLATSTFGELMRLFEAGDRGIKVDTGISVTVEVGSLNSLLMSTYY